MAGQGFHYGFAVLICRQGKINFSKELLAGTLILDALNSKAGTRRNTHFTGGAGCVLPRYGELRQVGATIQSWDSEFKKSYLVDPKIEMRLFEAASVHIGEGAYKIGLRIHLLADRFYDRFVQNKLFDVSHQAENNIIALSTGEEMDGATFRQELYASYPLLDQYLMMRAGITKEDFEEVKCYIESVVAPDMVPFFDKYLVWRDGLQWQDTNFFKKNAVDAFIDECVEAAVRYLKK